MPERYDRLLDYNREWAAGHVAEDPQYFEQMAEGQSPDFLFIGCSDSRVSAQEITGTHLGEMFVAEKGQGAWLNESRLRVSDRKRMIEAVFATGLPFGGRSDMAEAIQDLARLMPLTAGVRRWGAAALDLAYVAAGRFDGFWERKLNAWDIAAGLLLVREAGGLVEAVEPHTNPLEAGTVLAAAEPIFDTFAKVIRAG